MKYILMSIVAIMCGCTISFQNISTHGTASDVVDENQTTTPDIKADVTIPLKPI